MTEVIVVVPAPATGIDPGSGVVLSGPFVEGPDAHPQQVWFEGNRYGAENLTRWADRVHNAADRMLTRYPTTATLLLPAEQVRVLARYDVDTGVFIWRTPYWRDPLAAWLGHPPTDDDLTTTVAAHEAGRMMATLRAGTPEQQMQAQMLSSHGPALYRGR